MRSCLALRSLLALGCGSLPSSEAECDARAGEPLPRDWGELRSEQLVATSVTVLSTQGGRLDWGPDGRIVFDRRGEDGLYQVWVMDPEAPPSGTPAATGSSSRPRSRSASPWSPIPARGRRPAGLLPLRQAACRLRDPHPALRRRRPAGPGADRGVAHRGPRLERCSLGDPRLDPDDRYLVFTGYSDATGENNDILIAEPECRWLVDQVTATEDQWDEHAHFQPGVNRLLWSSSRDLQGGAGSGLLGALDSRADWSGEIRDLDGHLVQLPTRQLFAADGEFSPDGRAWAGVLLFRDLSAEEWIVRVELEERP